MLLLYYKFNGYLWLRYCLIALLTTIGSLTYGQNTYGIVSSDWNPLNGATINNLSSHKLFISGADGNFAIMATKGDSILTSFVGFKTDTLIYNNQSPLLIKLKAAASLLNEVVIKNSRVSPLDKFRKNQSDYKQIYRIGDNKQIFYIGIGFGISIDKLYSALSKEGKNARKLQRTLVRDYLDDIVDTRFTKSLVSKYTGYEGKQLDNFMIDNRPSYEFMKHASDYDIIKYIQQKSKEAASQNDTNDASKNKK